MAGFLEQQPTDEDLLDRYRDHGDRPAFEELVRRYEKELYGYLRQRLDNAQAAEDVFQQTFLQVHLKCDQFEAGRRLRPWLYAIATHQAIDYKRQHGRHRLMSLDQEVGGSCDEEACSLLDFLPGNEADPAQQADRLEQHADLHRALEGLSKDLRETVMLVYFQGLPYRDAAEALSIPVGTAKSRVHAAIKKLECLYELTPR
jgi:RNA polymerase sigma-70 factor (ECF subfamily)